jgi:hypothetical protein
VDYFGDRIEDMLIRRVAAVGLNLTGGARDASGGSRAGPWRGAPAL